MFRVFSNLNGIITGSLSVYVVASEVLVIAIPTTTVMHYDMERGNDSTVVSMFEHTRI